MGMVGNSSIYAGSTSFLCKYRNVAIEEGTSLVE